MEESSENFAGHTPGIRNFEFDGIRKDTSLFEETPGVFREPMSKYGSLLLALMHAGILKNCRIPVADYLNLDENVIALKGHLNLKVIDGWLEVECGHASMSIRDSG